MTLAMTMTRTYQLAAPFLSTAILYNIIPITAKQTAPSIW